MKRWHILWGAGHVDIMFNSIVKTLKVLLEISIASIVCVLVATASLMLNSGFLIGIFDLGLAISRKLLIIHLLLGPILYFALFRKRLTWGLIIGMSLSHIVIYFGIMYFFVSLFEFGYIFIMLSPSVIIGDSILFRLFLSEYLDDSNYGSSPN